jgi:hypothetical protein
MLPSGAFYKKISVKYIMANKKTARKNKSKRKSRRRGGGDNSLLNKTRTITIDPTEARRQAEQRRLEEEALRRQAAQRRQIQETLLKKKTVVSQLKTMAETKRILAEAAAKPKDWIKDKTNEEADARTKSLRSLFSAYGQ